MMLRVIMVMFLLFPLTAFSQNSFYKSTPGKDALGMSISFNENGKNLSGYLVSPIDNSTEAIFSVGIGLLDRIGLWDTEALKTFGASIPPAPSGAAALQRTSTLGTTGLQSFLTGGVGASSTKIVLTEQNETYLSLVDLAAFGGAGIFKRLKTSSDLVMTPSFGVFYRYTWSTAADKTSGEKEAVESGNLLGAVGMQLDLAPEFSIWGALSFSFDTSDTTLSVGVIWH